MGPINNPKNKTGLNNYIYDGKVTLNDCYKQSLKLILSPLIQPPRTKAFSKTLRTSKNAVSLPFPQL
jgi:hypothetical protein